MEMLILRESQWKFVCNMTVVVSFLTILATIIFVVDHQIVEHREAKVSNMGLVRVQNSNLPTIR